MARSSHRLVADRAAGEVWGARLTARRRGGNDLVGWPCHGADRCTHPTKLTQLRHCNAGGVPVSLGPLGICGRVRPEDPYRNTTVFDPLSSTRVSACQRTARETTWLSTSRPAATSSAASKRWST